MLPFELCESVRQKWHAGPGKRSLTPSSWRCHLPAGHDGDHRAKLNAHQAPWLNVDRIPDEKMETGVGHVYAITFQLHNGIVKIGRSGDPSRRLSQARTWNVGAVELSRTWEVPDMVHAESWVHGRLSDCRLSAREMFRVDVDMIEVLLTTSYSRYIA